MALPREGFATLTFTASIDGVTYPLRAQVEFDHGQYWLRHLPEVHLSKGASGIKVQVSAGSLLDPEFIHPYAEEHGAYTYSQVIHLHTISEQ